MIPATAGRRSGGVLMSRGHLYWILSNPIYVGRLRHKGQIHGGLTDFAKIGHVSIG